MKFLRHRKFFIDDLGWVGFSLGVHVSAWRVDFHVARWIVSVGRVPVYEDRNGKVFAASNSFHAFEQLPKPRPRREYLRPRI